MLQRGGFLHRGLRLSTCSTGMGVRLGVEECLWLEAYVIPASAGALAGELKGEGSSTKALAVQDHACLMGG